MEKRNLRAVLQIGLFVVVIMGLGLLSFWDIVHFYLTGEAEYNEWSAELGSRLETGIGAHFFHKFSFVNANGAVRNVLGQREMNGIVKMDNDYLVIPYERMDDEVLRRNAEQVIRLKKYLDEKGIELIYVVTPYTSDKYNPQMPTGVEDFGNDNLDRFAKMLADGGVNPLDIREELHEDGIDQYDMMYRTDHHWTSKAGFYAYQKINALLTESLHCEVDERISDMDNYTVTTYERWHLGSRGQRTGAYFAGIDDFDLIIPKFETALVRGEEMGTYKSLMMDESALLNRDQTSRYTYDTVLGQSEMDYMNEQCPNNVKLLVMADSFGKAVCPFLTITYKEQRFGVLDAATIEEYEPDAVIIMYYTDNALSDGIYNYDFLMAD